MPRMAFSDSLTLPTMIGSAPGVPAFGEPGPSAAPGVVRPAFGEPGPSLLFGGYHLWLLFGGLCRWLLASLDHLGGGLLASSHLGDRLLASNDSRDRGLRNGRRDRGCKGCG